MISRFEGGRGVREMVTAFHKGVRKSVTSHILAKIKAFKISKLNFVVILKLPEFKGIFKIGLKQLPCNLFTHIFLSFRKKHLT